MTNSKNVNSIENVKELFLGRIKKHYGENLVEESDTTDIISNPENKKTNFDDYASKLSESHGVEITSDNIRNWLISSGNFKPSGKQPNHAIQKMINEMILDSGIKAYINGELFQADFRDRDKLESEYGKLAEIFNNSDKETGRPMYCYYGIRKDSKEFLKGKVDPKTKAVLPKKRNPQYQADQHCLILANSLNFSTKESWTMDEWSKILEKAESKKVTESEKVK